MSSNTVNFLTTSIQLNKFYFDGENIPFKEKQEIHQQFGIGVKYIAEDKTAIGVGFWLALSSQDQSDPKPLLFKLEVDIAGTFQSVSSTAIKESDLPEIISSMYSFIRPLFAQFLAYNGLPLSYFPIMGFGTDGIEIREYSKEESSS